MTYFHLGIFTLVTLKSQIMSNLLGIIFFELFYSNLKIRYGKGLMCGRIVTLFKQAPICRSQDGVLNCFFDRKRS